MLLKIGGKVFPYATPEGTPRPVNPANLGDLGRELSSSSSGICLKKV